MRYKRREIKGGERGTITVKYVDTLPSLNLKLTKEAERFMADNQREIRIASPVFVDIEAV
ncbi:MAG: hypothetical protein ACP5E4_04495 [Candidatus Aenigmatarchaeota archaeon]